MFRKKGGTTAKYTQPWGATRRTPCSLFLEWTMRREKTGPGHRIFSARGPAPNIHHPALPPSGIIPDNQIPCRFFSPAYRPRRLRRPWRTPFGTTSFRTVFSIYKAQKRTVPGLLPPTFRPLPATFGRRRGVAAAFAALRLYKIAVLGLHFGDFLGGDVDGPAHILFRMRGRQEETQPGSAFLDRRE